MCLFWNFWKKTEKNTIVQLPNPIDFQKHTLHYLPRDYHLSALILIPKISACFSPTFVFLCYTNPPALLSIQSYHTASSHHHHSFPAVPRHESSSPFDRNGMDLPVLYWSKTAGHSPSPCEPNLMHHFQYRIDVLAKGCTEREVPNTISKSQLAMSPTDIQLNFWGRGSLKKTISGFTRPPHLQRGTESTNEWFCRIVLCKMCFLNHSNLCGLLHWIQEHVLIVPWDSTRRLSGMSACRSRPSMFCV